MKRALKISLVFAMIAASGSASGIAGDTGLRGAVDGKVATQWTDASRALEKIASLHFPRNYSVRAVGHGTHLCSDDEHCGSGHKCCSGHCKAVSTC